MKAWEVKTGDLIYINGKWRLAKSFSFVCATRKPRNCFCGRQASARGFCSMHYARFYRKFGKDFAPRARDIVQINLDSLISEESAVFSFNEDVMVIDRDCLVW